MNALPLRYLNDIIFGFIEATLAMRVVLKLLGAATAAPFVNWVYEITGTLIAPFRGMFPSPVLTGGFVIEASTLFALLAYALIAYGIREFLFFITAKSKYYQEEEEKGKEEVAEEGRPRRVHTWRRSWQPDR